VDNAILTEWTRTDIGYSARAYLNGTMSGGMNVVNGMSVFLNASTVFGNGLADNLYGGPGLDWSFAGVLDILFNKATAEVVTLI